MNRGSGASRRGQIAMGLFIVSAILLHFDTESIIHRESPAPVASAVGALDSRAGGFLEREYDNAVKEIQERIRQEGVLFGFKFTLVGAILALIFSNRILPAVLHRGRSASSPDESGHPLDESQSPPMLQEIPATALFCWAAIATSAIIDTRILYNAESMRTQGDWIKQHVEAVLIGNGLVGWERFIDERSPFFRSHLYPLMRANAHVLTLVLLIGTAYLFSEAFARGPARGWIQARMICRAGGIASFAIMWLGALSFHYQQPGWALWCTVWLVVGVVACLNLWRLPRDPGAEIVTRVP